MRAQAEALYSLIDQDPAQAERAALELASLAAGEGDGEAQALALRAGAVAARARDVDEARHLAERAKAIAEVNGLWDTADRVRVTAAGIEVFAGHHAIARRALQAIAGRDDGEARWEALAQLGFLHLLADEYERAITCFDRAEHELPSGSIWIANTLSNRGLARGYLGMLDRAAADLEAAIDAFAALGAFLAVAEARQNLGWVRDLAGDYVGALRSFAEAEAVLEDTPASRGYLLRDRANTLLAVGLAADAAESAHVSSEAFEEAGRQGDAADSLLVEAMALWLAGEPQASLRTASKARSMFLKQDRPLRADQADLIALRAVAGESATAEALADARQLVDRLEQTAAHHVALEARLMAARLSLASGDAVAATGDLHRAQQAGSSPRHDLRIGYWEIAAEISEAEGELAEALACAGRGLEVLEESQRTLGSTEARVNISSSARRVGAVALRVAHSHGARDMFDWTERVRAGALRFRPVRPEGDDELDEHRSRLRSLAREIDEGQLEGRDVSHLVRESEELENAVRLRLLEARGESSGERRRSSSDVQSAIGDGVLVAYVGVEGQLVAVRVDRTSVDMIELAPFAEVRREVDHLRFAARRLTSGRPAPRLTGGTAKVPAVTPAGVENVQASARLLDELVMAPVDQSDRHLVVVPMGVMFTIPWALLPSAGRRPMSITPSATTWLSAMNRRPGGGGEVLAAGPELEHADDEVTKLARVWSGATILSGRGATADAVLEAGDGADLFHAACHGVFRADNPLFSNLRMADGPLAVHELEMLERAPATVVLSSCDVGLTQPRPGDEWLGMATALLSLGTRSLVASVAAVPDAQVTVRLMEELHRRLQAGQRPAEALHAAGQILDPKDPSSLAARSAFLCIGS